jgi:hypothetical protein
VIADESIETAPFGRPTKYRDEYAQQAYKLCLLGATDGEMANFFEVCEATITNWKRDYPDFLASIRDGKIKADAHLAHKLYCRAEGAEWEEEQAFKVKTGPHSERVETVTVKRAAPPDTSALIMWLTNRQRGLWRNTQSLQQLDKNGNPTDGPLRVQVVLVGEAAPQVEHETKREIEALPIKTPVTFVG